MHSSIVTVPTAHALIRRYRIQYMTQNILFICKVVLLPSEKSRSLESVNDAKTGKQSVFSEIHTNHSVGTP